MIFYFVRRTRKLHYYGDVIHSFDWKISCRTRWSCLTCVIVYLAQDIPAFVMYCVYGESGSSLLTESTNSVADLENEKGWFQVTLVRGKFFVGHAHLRSREDTYLSHGVCGRKTQETNKWIVQGTQTRSRQEIS